MLKGKSLKQKLISLCILLNAVVIIVAAVGYYGLTNVATSYKHVTTINFPKTRELGVMLANFREIRIELRTLGMNGLSPSAAEAATQATIKAIEDYKSAARDFNALESIEGEAELYEDVEKAWQAFEAIGVRALNLQKSTDPTAKQKMADIFHKECAPAAAAFNNALQKLMKFHINNANSWSQTASSTEVGMIWLVVLISVIGSGLGLTIGLFFANSLTASIRKVSQDLAVGADQVASASSQISESSQELSSAATQQAAALQETVASIDEVSAMVSKNADNAKKSQTTAQASANAAQRGKQAVSEVIASIEEISDSNLEIMQQIERSNQEIAEIVKVIGDIGNKTKVINDIVFQTKLLSFNASVEAARAGEHGKGFAVVAEEVGNLAQMSGNAAKEISQMLETSIQKVEKIVEDSKSKVERMIVTGKEKVATGTHTARKCGDVLDEIVENVSEVTMMVNEIATASQEQAQGVHEITKAMAQMDHVTQQNSATSQQTASSSEQLSAQAESLRGVVSVLTTTVEGEDVASPPRMSAAPKPKRSNVVPLKTHKRETENLPVRRAAGGETVPSPNDPRFEEF